MATAGINIPIITPKAAAVDDSGMRNNTISITNDVGCSHLKNDGISSFCNLHSVKQQPCVVRDEVQCDEVQLEDLKIKVENVPECEKENSISSSAQRNNEFHSDYIGQGDIENIGASQLSPGLSLLQQTATASSPPPHSYRHSRAYRHFKNPPQPHMCIRTTTENGEELYINVLSWTRIVIPQEPSDPIPLYGGMRVPPGSPRSPLTVFAVMANPEVLKDSGRHSKDPEERRAMVELMCDFVEAMNPDIKLVRNAIILKDRDISGELKDVWNAVQAQRDREREEQMLLQRQQHQQHFHNIANGGSFSNTFPPANSVTAITQQINSKSMQSDDGILMTVDGGTPPRSRKIIQEVQNSNIRRKTDEGRNIEMITNTDQEQLTLLAEHIDNKTLIAGAAKSEECAIKQTNSPNTLPNDALSNGNNSKDSLEVERNAKTDINNQLNTINCNNDHKREQVTLSNGFVANCNIIDVSNITKSVDTSQTQTAAISVPAPNLPTNVVSLATSQQAPTKKEKLGGFLPNGCLFPRFTKTNKHKDKDKEKEPKAKDKEKNALLSALKKSKDKKINAATAANANEKNVSANSKITAANSNYTNTKQQKNCLQQLESGVQKLDLNNHLHSHISESNLNKSTTTTTTTNNTNITTNNTNETNKNTQNTTSNNDIVGVH